MTTIKLGKMEKSYGCYPSSISEKPEKDEDMIERFPTVYINLDSLPDLKPGQEVTLKGVVTSFSDKKVRTKEDGKEEIETVRNCEIDILEMTPGEAKGIKDPPNPNEDEDAVEKGLDDAEESNEDDNEEEE